MELVAALKRVGATVISNKVVEPTPESLKGMQTLHLRIDPEQGEKWVECMSNLLLATGNKEFKVDVSKAFYADRGVVKYLWRIVLSGNVTQGRMMLSAAAVEAAMANVKEFDSFPLVGRIQYQLDPLRGKIKGGHDYDVGVGILSIAMGGSSPGSA